MTRIALILTVVVLAVATAACGGSDSSSTEATATTGAAAETTGAPCTKEALAEGAKSSIGKEEVKVLDGFVCEGGWASGPILVGPDGSEEQIEAAFIVKDENGKWTVPAKLPCDDADVSEKVLDNSPCRVS